MENPRLKYWSIIVSPPRDKQNGEHHDLVFALFPNANPVCLIGKVYNHPKYKDGDVIVTHDLTGFNELDEIATTHSRDYELDEESEPYKKFRESIYNEST
ncbi:MAG: hypothetical protein K0S38_256 [Candidatus Paceibacter sp.]|jgi:hypothetical protein|nr:hypothetical protein [Candidatus Paceibacter sp.]